MLVQNIEEVFKEYVDMTEKEPAMEDEDIRAERGDIFIRPSRRAEALKAPSDTSVVDKGVG